MSTSARLSKARIEGTLSNWIGFNKAVMCLDLRQLEQLIDYEKKHRNRKSFLSRLIKRKYVVMRNNEFKKLGLN